VIRALYETARSVDDRPPTEAVATLAERVLDLPGLDDRDRAILQFVIRLTLSPRSMRASEVETLRAAGLDDLAIHDVVEVVSCFSFMNRLADGTGVAILEGRYELAREMLGDEPLRRHLEWARSSKAE